ncbi:30S ribosomal protein S9 [Exophiala viscosa]|uniref:Small ribosomal subunit protein uS9m n=1 Tax=Exophiala viscosa TaxID=2486360 RepID=A0AAN6IHP6_9EURO|nr:30S ribosomal protein S9 [Exophiala viscosa]KAI1626637.1 30S ribosomal protein S9 [Exophiala viscosa]
MATPARALPSAISWTCRQCRLLRGSLETRAQTARLPLAGRRQNFSTTKSHHAEVQIRAAPEIDLDDPQAIPARIIPASPSYFTASPLFNDHVLLLQSLVKKHSSLPIAPPELTPRAAWLKLSQYRSSVGEKIAASKYTKVLHLLTRLNKIHRKIRPKEVKQILDEFRRPGSEELQKAKPGKIDEYGRSTAIGRRKESSAKVYLVEGTGEVLVNGRSLVQAFPRLHDRESALWALKATERMDKYNVFAMVSGGGVTGQAEAITLGLAKALLVHEPALKPALRRAGCVTSDMRRVERKKPGRLKARKRPTWVKR